MGFEGRYLDDDIFEDEDEELPVVDDIRAEIFGVEGGFDEKLFALEEGGFGVDNLAFGGDFVDPGTEIADSFQILTEDQLKNWEKGARRSAALNRKGPNPRYVTLERRLEIREEIARAAQTAPEGITQR